ncbi:putative disease resistance protein At4g19050 isoform X3 [Hibiscus syriacus]|uniref:putative disease resistance protein At4g19050 isoform X3 n=1 Tax=Hibiscus syriacus TaxID=106335 RepID=UPI0019232170|nr:putative disease resistance protein At4g19050 isoform X3 [Hibiscus syriacus]
MDEYCRRGYWGTGDPGLASVLKGIDRAGHVEIPPARVLDGITPADGMMRTLCGHKKEKMISSLLIDGSRLCREVHEAFFGKTESLNLLAIFSPRLKSPEELSISKPEKLLVLMLRGSYLLENVKFIEKLTALTILEISGSRDCKIKLPDNFFNLVSQLRSLDFSGTGIESLPASFSELTELRRLILRRCSNLEEPPKLANFKKLEKIDLSDCTRLKKIQEKSFRSFEKLKVINFSNTQIEKLPIVKTLENLSIILLQGCTALSGMRILKNVKSIKVLDLSGATNIKEIMYDCFEGASNLRDLSETRIQYLPPAIGDLQKLRLKKCGLLRNLPVLSGQKRLEELDLSGCTMLEELPDLSDLVKLKILNLRDIELYNEELVKSLSHIKGLKILS